MSLMTIAPAATEPADGNSYDTGYFDGELDAIAKTPSGLVHDRASMADAYDPLWAQGYIDGYLHQIQVTYELAQKDAAR
jgi:hypothetical protein